MYRKFVIPYSAKSTSSSTKKARQNTINDLVQKALDSGDWSTLRDMNVTKSELNTAVSKSSYKKVKNLSTAQQNQLTQATMGNFNKYESSSSTNIVQSNGDYGQDDRPTASAADLLAAKKSMEDSFKSVSELLGQYSVLNNPYENPDYTNVDDATLQSVQQLQNTLGTNINYDYDNIKGIYDEAARQGYEIEQESGAERSYYQHLADAQNTALDTIRQQYGQAVASGASKGMQAAQQLSAILGTTQQANAEATQLAIDKQSRANEYAQQVAQNARDALSYSNQQQMDLANLSRTLYNDSIQKQTAQLGYNQSLNTDKANVASAYLNAQGSLNGSIANTIGGVYNNNQSAIAQLQSAIEQANGNVKAAKASK